MSNAFFKSSGAAFVGILLLSLSSPALAQKITLGVLAGASLTDDFRNSSYTLGNGTLGNGQIWRVTNASQWFMLGPTMDLAFSEKISVEVDAIRRRVRSTETREGPVELPDGTISAIIPFSNDGFTWQVSALGKYKLSAQRLSSVFELGFSFRPQENRDQTGITTGAGVAFPIGRATLTPTLRYTRWLTDNGFGAVPDQVQFLVGLREASDSRSPTLLGRPLSLGFVVGSGMTKLLKDRSYPVFQNASTSDPVTPIAGIRIGIPVIDNMAVEVDGLYRGTHRLEAELLPDGSIRKTGEHTAFLTWQFPVLAKYKIPVGKVSPLIELGPAFRITAHTQTKDYAHYGAAAGLGISARIGKMSVSPTLRYTRWARDKQRFGHEPETATSPNQLEVVVGFSF